MRQLTIRSLRSVRAQIAHAAQARGTVRGDAALRDALRIERDDLVQLTVTLKFLLILLRRVDKQFKHCPLTSSLSLVMAGFLHIEDASVTSVLSWLNCRLHRSKVDSASFSYWSASTGGREAGCDCFVGLLLMVGRVKWSGLADWTRHGLTSRATVTAGVRRSIDSRACHRLW